MLVVHHLNESRSQRILWLLEELGAPYEIAFHQRDAETRLAPPELVAVHPLGKSPVIVDDGRVVHESGAVIDYIIRKHGSQWRADPAPNHRARLTTPTLRGKTLAEVAKVLADKKPVAPLEPF